MSNQLLHWINNQVCSGIKKTTSFLIPFTVFGLYLNDTVLNNSLFRIFRDVVYCLIIKVLFCFLLTRSSQLNHNIMSLLSCQHFFKKFFNFFSDTRFSLFSIIYLQYIDWTLVHKKLSETFFVPDSHYWLTEKEGFEPSRRSPDLHP